MNNLPPGIDPSASLDKVDGSEVADETLAKLAREMAEAIASAASADPKVEACRQHARAEGFDMRVSLEAVIGFASRSSTALVKPGPMKPTARRPLEISANDRRFLRSLRIAVDESAEDVG